MSDLIDKQCDDQSLRHLATGRRDRARADSAMKIGIYNEPSGSIGGSEYVVSVAAHALSGHHEVEIVHHNPTLERGQLAALSGLDLNRVSLRFVEREPRPDPRLPSGVTHLPDRYRAEARWHAHLSQPYDLFVNSTHAVPPFCHARTGVLITLFPAHDRRIMWPWAPSAAAEERPWKARAQRAGCAWLWKKRFGSYRHRLSISEYSKMWTRRWWDIETSILYPPVDIAFNEIPKANLVLSVGRFATYSHSKRQIDTMTAYRDMRARSLLQGWCCSSVGGLAENSDDRHYFDEVCRLAAECGAHVTPNIRREELRTLFERAKIFWHAAGYGAGPDASPFQAEHFGIATVEAMAAGAVPVVYDHGGQAEIVEHGRSGFLWRTLEELQDYTVRLAGDERLRERMGAAARVRASRFSRETFVRNLLRLVE